MSHHRKGTLQIKQKVVQDFPHLQPFQQASKKTGISECMRKNNLISGSMSPARWDLTEFLHWMFWRYETQIILPSDQFPCSLGWRIGIDTCSICFTRVCVCVCVSQDREHYLWKCSSKYRELDFFSLLVIAQKYNSHQWWKAVLLSLRKVGQNGFVLFHLSFKKWQGINLQTSAGIRHPWRLVSDCWAHPRFLTR